MILFSIMFLSFVLLTSYVEDQSIGENKKTEQEERLGNEGLALLNPQKYELKIGVALNDDVFVSLQKLNEEYEERYPNIQIIWKRFSEEDAYEYFLDQVTNGHESLDIMLLDNEWIYAFATRGLLAPLDEQTTKKLNSRIPVGANRLLSWNDHLWAIPMDIDPIVLVYNRDVLQENNFTPATSFEMLWSQHAQLSTTYFDEMLPEQYGFYFNPLDLYAVATLLWSYSGLTTGDELQTWLFEEGQLQTISSLFLRTVASLEKEEVEKVQQWDPVDLYPLETTSFNAWRLLEEGKMAYRLARLSEYKLHKGVPNLIVSTFPVQEVRDGASLWYSGRSWSISSSSTVQEQARHWILTMTQDKQQLDFSQSAGTLPAAESALLSGKTGWTREFVEPWFYEGQTMPPTPEYVSQKDEYASQLQQLWQGDVQIDTLVKTIHQGWNPASSLLP